MQNYGGGYRRTVLNRFLTSFGVTKMVLVMTIERSSEDWEMFF